MRITNHVYVYHTQVEMMRYIHSAPHCNNNETPTTTCSSTDRVPRPTTLSSFLSSLSCQSYGSIGSCTSLLFRNTSSSRINHNTSTDYLVDERTNCLLETGATTSVVVPSIQPSSSLLQVTPADNEYDMHRNNDHCGITLSNSGITTCSDIYSTVSNDGDKVESESYPKPIRASDLHQQSHRQWYLKVPDGTTDDETNATMIHSSANTTTVTILPTKIPKTYRAKRVPKSPSRKPKNVAVNKVKSHKVKRLSTPTTTISLSSSATIRPRKIKIPRQTKTTPTDATDATATKTTTIRKKRNRGCRETSAQGGTKRQKKERPVTKVRSSESSRDDTLEKVVSNDNNNTSTTTTTDGDPPLESSVSLDEWQQQFLQFITYPSDHIHTRTGTKVSLRDTIVWGRQKVLWTTPFLQMNQRQRNDDSTRQQRAETELPLDVVSSNTTINNAGFSFSKRTKRGAIPSKAGGNHLSQQLVVKAALAAVQQQNEKDEIEETGHGDDNVVSDENIDTGTTTFSNCGIASDMLTKSSTWSGTCTGGSYCISDDELFALDDFTEFGTDPTDDHQKTMTSPKSKVSEVLMIRRNEEQALWFHGGTSMNQHLGEWLQKERETYCEHHAESIRRQAQYTSERCRPKGTRRVTLSEREMNERYNRIQRSLKRLHTVHQSRLVKSLIPVDFLAVTVDF